MVAYSFKTQFIEPIRAGSKRQTIRAERKRHARPGEELQLYSGMRTKHCVLIGRATCLSVAPMRLFLKKGRVSLDTGSLLTRASLDAFSRADGFEDWSQLVAFWAENHPGVDPFSGVLITWGRLSRAPGEVAFDRGLM